ncbi:MAG: PIG-L family deacetylase [Chloroflexi bacterium]|nr:PIG-L family deacetylase [Chloroflexota bacterium]
MHFIYVSPHLDDAIFSCGGMIWEQVHQGDQVEIHSIFTSDLRGRKLPEYASKLHERWGGEDHPYRLRRAEDQKACDFLGVTWRHMNYLDCIYRYLPGTDEPLIQVDADLFLPADREGSSLAGEIRADLCRGLAADSILVCPLGVGGHVDHRVTRLAVEGSEKPVLYYPDFPYAALRGIEVSRLLPPHVKSLHYKISPDALQAWQRGIALYPSQMDSFWKQEKDMVNSLEQYSRSEFSGLLWKKQVDSQGRPAV